MTNYILREFRQRTGIRTEIVVGGTGDLLERVKRGGDNKPADVFWGGGVESLETIKGNLVEYRSPEDEAINDDCKDPDGRWSPFSVLPIVIMYNRKLVSEADLPLSWAKLLAPVYRNHLTMADPPTSGSSFTILMTLLRTMSHGGSTDPAGWGYVEKLVGQLGADGLVESSAKAYNSVASGEFYAVITFENSALSLKMAGRDVDFCYPSEGTSAVPDGIALVKGGSHPEEAKLFIDFALGRDLQSILMSRWFRRSVRKDVPASGIAVSGMRLVNYPIAESASMREPVLDHWAELRSRYRP